MNGGFPRAVIYVVAQLLEMSHDVFMPRWGVTRTTNGDRDRAERTRTLMETADCEPIEFREMGDSQPKGRFRGVLGGL